MHLFRLSLGALAKRANRTVTAAFVTTSTVPNGTIIHGTARAQDTGGDTALADASTAVFQ